MNLIKGLEKIPLSGDDLTIMARKLGVETSFILYEHLEGHTLESLPEKLFILFNIKDRSGMNRPIGHWALLMQKPLVYYDPYGLKVSQEIMVSHKEQFLNEILRGKRVDVNIHRHQQIREETNTCGRHAVVRSIFNISNDQYNKSVIVPSLVHVDSPDTLVALITAFLSESDLVLKDFFNITN